MTSASDADWPCVRPLDSDWASVRALAATWGPGEPRPVCEEGPPPAPRACPPLARLSEPSLCGRPSRPLVDPTPLKPCLGSCPQLVWVSV